MPITPYYLDNRGTHNQPFGFVYFRRGRRDAGERIGFCASRADFHLLAVWNTTDTGPINSGGRDAIRKYLARAA